MPGAAGPELPPHILAKRKRKQEEAAASASKQAAQPAAEAPAPDSSPKRRKVIGPAAPPAPLDQRPVEPANSDDSDSDDDYGPAPPTAAAHAAAVAAAQPADNDDSDDSGDAPGPALPKSSEPTPGARDAWMTMPPTADSLSRMDPTKQRARGFKTGPNAGKTAAGGGGMSAAWTETPEEKRKRLENEMLGIAPAVSDGQSNRSNLAKKQEQDKKADQEKARRIKEGRGPSLMDSHRKEKGISEDDDPSKRGFDWEKDMKASTLGTTMNKSEMAKKSANFNSRFFGGGFL